MSLVGDEGHDLDPPEALMFRSNRPDAEERMAAARREQQRLLLEDLRNRPSAQRHRVLLPLVGAEEAVDDVDDLRPAS